jgi:Ca2+-binding RTX toxin-like protein
MTSTATGLSRHSFACRCHNAYGQKGADKVLGGNGSDITLSGGNGDDRTTLGAGVYGNDGLDTVFGNDAIDTVYGNGGPDYLYGNDDNDALHAQDGNTDYFIDGGPGFNNCYIDVGYVILVFHFFRFSSSTCIRPQKLSIIALS